eukprot:9769463-Alexandrium_andersonii.AAC.1
MSASLVGSEMCIRDRISAGPVGLKGLPGAGQKPAGPNSCAHLGPADRAPVSYTHLTLPTICSV